MEPASILFIILIIVTADFLFEELLDFLNLKSQKTTVPPEMQEYYDKEKYATSLKYHKVTGRFGFITSTFSFVLSFAMLYWGGFGWLDTWLRPLIDQEILLSLAYFGILFLASDILNTPFQIYSTFVIEERFGFNKTTPKTFVLDKLKGYGIAFVLGGLIGFVFLWLVQIMGQNFWLYFLAVIAVFIVFMNMFYTTLLLPLFNKLTPLEDGELKTAIEAYCNKVQFPLTNIFVIDGSKRSSKANAFFSGLGKKKKVVLYDTLIENHSQDELIAIFAHEVGHFKKKHIVYGLVLSLLQMAIMLFILSLMIANVNLSLAMGGEVVAIHLNLLAFGILYSPVSKLTGLLMLVFSRKNEYEADAYASATFDGASLSVALKKLSVDNLSNLFPHPAYVFFNYSHPPLLKRVKAIDSLN
jgi:STE24 endopeptidase